MYRTEKNRRIKKKADIVDKLELFGNANRKEPGAVRRL